MHQSAVSLWCSSSSPLRKEARGFDSSLLPHYTPDSEAAALLYALLVLGIDRYVQASFLRSMPTWSVHMTPHPLTTSFEKQQQHTHRRTAPTRCGLRWPASSTPFPRAGE